MATPNEMIEVSFDDESNQVTIVVGNDSDSVQCVIVLKMKKDRDTGPSKPFARSNSNVSNVTSGMQHRRRKLRSDLLRPESPMTQRSSVFDGRRAERDQPPAVRRREYSRNRARCGGSYKQRSTTSSHDKEGMDHIDLHIMSEYKSYTYTNTASSTRAAKYFRANSKQESQVDPVVMIADV